MAQNITYNSVVAAKFIAAKLKEKGRDVNITKIQKLLYVAYGLYLAVFDVRFVDEHPQAWPYGPVFPTTRNKLCKDETLAAISLQDPDLEAIIDDAQVNALFESIYSVMGDWTASQLVEWSHQPDSPWDYCTRMEGFKWGTQMDDNLIKLYFNSLLIKDRPV